MHIYVPFWAVFADFNPLKVVGYRWDPPKGSNGCAKHVIWAIERWNCFNTVTRSPDKKVMSTKNPHRNAFSSRMRRAVTAGIIQMTFCTLNPWLDVVIYFKRHQNWYRRLGGAGANFRIYRASICEGGLGSRNSVRLSVCLSVTRTHCNKTKWRTADILYRTKGQSLCYSDTKSGWWATPLPSEIWAQNDPPPSKNADFDRFPLITSQPYRDSEKSSITTNIKSTMAFQRAIDGVRTLPLSALKGGSKSDLSLFEPDRLRRCQLGSPVSVLNMWWSAAILITPTVDKCM